MAETKLAQTAGNYASSPRSREAGDQVRGANPSVPASSFAPRSSGSIWDFVTDEVVATVFAELRM